MDNSTFFIAYLATFIVCIAITVLLIILTDKGLRRFIENLVRDKEIAVFFIKLIKIIIILAGVGAALTGGYNTGEGSNWLTLSWDVARQMEESLSKLFVTLMILALAFFIFHLIGRYTDK